MATTAAWLDRPIRTRDTTVLGRIVAALAAALPGVGRWLTTTARRARRAALHVAGLGAIVAAGWEVSRPLGLVTAGVSLLLLEYLSAPEAETRR
jgi:hypothetical protein